MDPNLLVAVAFPSFFLGAGEGWFLGYPKGWEDGYEDGTDDTIDQLGREDV